jgi:preprotein translocase subunit SecF
LTVFRLLKNPNFDFMAHRRLFLSLSMVVVLASITTIAVKGLNPGIEFTGGTELQLRFTDTPDVGAIRSTLGDAGMGGVAVTTIGDPSENEVYIRLATRSDGEESEDPTSAVIQALRGPRDDGGSAGAADLNVADQTVLLRALSGAPELSGDSAEELAAAILERRKDQAVFHTVGELADVDGMTAEVLAHLEQSSYIGPLALRSQSYIGPAIGRELMNKALFAILGSMLGMLIYIWIRFQLQWGFAAVVALAHDSLVTLGLFSLFGQEMTLPVVAAFLTLVGYSVNDTVVVFDRIRENLRLRRGAGLESVVNLSINQTLSRTIITSGLTWVVVFSLYVFGGAALRPFSFVLSVGVLVGTYSSIYVASPFLVLWSQFVGKRKAAAAASERRSERRAKKVRS